MPDMGLLFVTSEPPAAMEEEYNEWYDKEHVPERLSIPGFRSALRYVSAQRDRRYLALYDLDQVGVLSTPEYRAWAGANFTPWTKRVTTRSRFVRHEMVQEVPGDADTTVAASRLLVLRFAPADGVTAATVAQALRQGFPPSAGVLQLRVFRITDGPETGICACIAGHGALETRLDPDALGAVGPHLTSVEAFTPY